MNEDSRHLGKMFQRYFRGDQINDSLESIRDSYPESCLAGENDHLFYDHLRFRFIEKTTIEHIQRAMQEYYSKIPGWGIYFDGPQFHNMLLGTICPPGGVVLSIVGAYEDTGESNIFSVGFVSSQ